MGVVITNKFFSLLCLLLCSLPVISAQESVYGSNFDETCANNVCVRNVYSFQKYYHNGAEWKTINERFNTNNCESGYEFCVDKNVYQFHTQSTYGNSQIIFNGQQLSFELTEITDEIIDTTSALETQDNIAVYKNIVPGIDLQYTYLSHKIKEELIIHEKSTVEDLTTDMVLTFDFNTYGADVTTNDEGIFIGDFVLRDFLAYDAVDNYLTPSYSYTGDQLTLTVDKDWLLDEERTYPVVIDPGVSVNASVSEDLHVYHNAPSTWTRQSSLNHFRVGKKRTTSGGFPPSISVLIYRGSIDWDITGIPTDATILALNLTLYANQNGSDFNENISTTQMESNSTAYTDDDSGNEQYWNDMLNGTIYTTITMSGTGFKSFNLTNATNDFENALTTGTFSIGLANTNDTKGTSVDVKEWRFRSVETAAGDRRPVLTVTYAVANGSDANTAIETGIRNTLPDAIIHSDQQIYTRLSNGTQELGRFDRFAVNHSQRWAFNYIDGSQQFMFMKNITPVFYVLEMFNLTSLQIETTVQEFINGTL